MPKVNVKWGSRLLDVDVNMEEAPMLLKAQLFGLTDVPPERQKLILKGKTIGDDNWKGLSLKDGSTLLLVGGLGPTSIESHKPENMEGNGIVAVASNKKQIQLPVGLKNLGNTCYMNSTIQCFKVIPELEYALGKMKFTFENSNDGAHRSNLLKNSMKKLYDEMNILAKKQQQSKEEDNVYSPKVTPLLFLHILHQIFPQFATQDERGNFQQQDANECFCEVMRMLTEETFYESTNNTQSTTESQPNKIPLKKFFELEMDVTIKCLEEGSSEEPKKSLEKIYQLSCFLSQEVRYIQSGIINKMTEEIEKLSQDLGRNARYQKASLISRLPAYLSVQIVRFFFKEKEKINAKILKDVKFPLVLDVFSMCTPELQEKLKPARQALKEYDDAKVELQRQAKLAHPDDPKIEIKPKGYFPNTFEEDPGSNNSGFYELKALITHKGRASNHGHYVAWVRVDDADEQTETSKWAACDDTDVYLVSEEEILKLSGGGDWHCAYLLLYGPKKIPKL